jgi:hypothetical protein
MPLRAESRLIIQITIGFQILCVRSRVCIAPRELRVNNALVSQGLPCCPPAPGPPVARMRAWRPLHKPPHLEAD